MDSLRILALAVFATLVAGATCGGAADPAVSPATQELRPLIGVSDVVEVRIFGEPDLSGVHRVGPGGTVRLPLVGDVAVDGLTPHEAADRIAAAYNEKYLRNAQVSVHVQEFHSRKIFVLGQVSKPGSYPYEERMTVIAAIARAGGTAKLADGNRTVITREEEGRTVRLQVRVADIQRGQAPDVELMPGDIIFVPETLF